MLMVSTDLRLFTGSSSFCTSSSSAACSLLFYNFYIRSVLYKKRRRQSHLFMKLACRGNIRSADRPIWNKNSSLSVDLYNDMAVVESVHTALVTYWIYHLPKISRTDKSCGWVTSDLHSFTAWHQICHTLHPYLYTSLDYMFTSLKAPWACRLPEHHSL